VWQSLLLTALLSAVAPLYETYFKSNQTLKPLAQALKSGYHPGDAIVVLGNLPQGLPFYAYPIINATNRPYLSGYSPHHIPFEFPGNIQRMGSQLLTNDIDLLNLLSSPHKTWVIGFNGAFMALANRLPTNELALISHVGRWELFCNDSIEKASYYTKHENGELTGRHSAVFFR